MHGTLRKMKASLGETVHYELPVGDERLALNDRIGEHLTLAYTGQIYCIACGRRTNKSFSQGYCYPCMTTLAACDMCIVKPETCHYHLGTCREPDWGERNCMIPHVVYLANTSGLKVGITRESQVPTRWIDQGATQALPLFRVKTRRISGEIETALAKSMADKTNWRAMLKGDGDVLDLPALAEGALPGISARLEEVREAFGDDAVERLEEAPVEIRFPVETYPVKVASFNLDKKPEAGGRLMGIKGQYLIFDTGVINVRKYAGYEIDIG